MSETVNEIIDPYNEFGKFSLEVYNKFNAKFTKLEDDGLTSFRLQVGDIFTGINHSQLPSKVASALLAQCFLMSIERFQKYVKNCENIEVNGIISYNKKYTLDEIMNYNQNDPERDTELDHVKFFIVVLYNADTTKIKMPDLFYFDYDHFMTNSKALLIQNHYDYTKMIDYINRQYENLICVHEAVNEASEKLEKKIKIMLIGES